MWPRGRVLDALAEGLGSIPSAVYNSSSRGQDTLFCPSQALGTHSETTQTHKEKKITVTHVLLERKIKLFSIRTLAHAARAEEDRGLNDVHEA